MNLGFYLYKLQLVVLHVNNIITYFMSLASKQDKTFYKIRGR